MANPSNIETEIGQCFLLGFRGTEIPDWLKEFADRFSIGSVIVFDYDCQTKTYHNNIESKGQLTDLCAEIHQLRSRPMISIDQEGGKVRRLKEDRGFAPLPSQLEINRLPEKEQSEILFTSYREMAEIGIDLNLTPVVDVNYNKDGGDIGRFQRAYSDNPDEVIRSAQILNKVAAETGIALCLKHFPGMGASKVNSHFEFADISDDIKDEQLEVFYSLAEEIFGQMVMIGHGVVRHWNESLPSSIAPECVRRLRDRGPHWLITTDDLQMQGLQKVHGTEKACELALLAGVDMLCLGNNLLDQQDQMISLAENLIKKCHENSDIASNVQASIQRVKDRKGILRKN